MNSGQELDRRALLSFCVEGVPKNITKGTKLGLWQQNQGTHVLAGNFVKSFFRMAVLRNPFFVMANSQFPHRE
jgi:hypothetical protein